MPTKNVEQKKKTFRRIDHSKIKDGETLSAIGVHDKEGNFLRPVPYIEQTKEEITKEKEIIEKKMKNLGKVKPANFSKKENKIEDKEVDTKALGQAEKLIELIEEQKIELFHDETKEAYASIPNNDQGILKLKSGLFALWASRLFWEKIKKPISTTTLQTALQILEAKACFDGSCYELHVRVAWHNDSLWYDLGDGSAVEVNKEEWKVVKDPPILFKRFSHQKPQVHPKKGGKIKDILSFINISNSNEQLLFQIATISNFIPGFPHAILTLHGSQGSAKSTLSKLYKDLIDPSIIQTQAPPRDLTSFVQMASHHWLIILDNLSSLPGWLSDGLARACSGEGFSKRQLYTDDKDIVYTFQRVLSINGISLVASKADLIQRSILLELTPISEDKRREESEFWKKFQEKKPYILGAIFDILVKTLNKKSKVKIKKLPRMADFAKWGCAIAEAMNLSETMFINAYNSNIKDQNRFAIEASPTAIAIVELMKNRNLWEETPSKTLSKLDAMADHLGINRGARNWPKDVSWLGRRIKEAAVNLKTWGIDADLISKEAERKIIIKKIVEKNAVNAVNGVLPYDTKNSKDTIPANKKS